MDDLDGRLSALIAEVRHNPANSRKWRTAMHKLLLEIQQLPGLKKLDHQNYPAALNLTLEWVSREIAKFEPRPPSVQKVWLTGSTALCVGEFKICILLTKMLQLV